MCDDPEASRHMSTPSGVAMIEARYAQRRSHADEVCRTLRAITTILAADRPCVQ
jgi:hypothetical protein